jgi:ankyrin repeat protein
VAEGYHIDVLDEHGFTPLALAACAGHHQTVLQLLQLGADPNIKGTGQQSADPLTFAIWEGHATIVEALLSHGAYSVRRAALTECIHSALGAGHLRRDHGRR